MTPRTYSAGLMLIISLLVTGLCVLRAEQTKSQPKSDKTETPTDLLATVKEWNSDKFAAPPTTFRQGHVTSRPLEEKAVMQTKGGFVVQLPSKAPMVAPVSGAANTNPARKPTPVQAMILRVMLSAS